MVLQVYFQPVAAGDHIVRVYSLVGSLPPSISPSEAGLVLRRMPSISQDPVMQFSIRAFAGL